MSTIAYALMTSARRRASVATPPGQAPGKPQDETPEVSTYVKAMAALVPAEVLTLHALMLSVTTDTIASTTAGAAGAETAAAGTGAAAAGANAIGAAGAATIRITDPHTLSIAFFGLMATSIVLYVVPKLVKGGWVRRDYARAAIPPLAFVAWTMLQRATAFDAVWTGLTDAPRSVSALFLAVALGLAATVLGYKKTE